MTTRFFGTCWTVVLVGAIGVLRLDHCHALLMLRKFYFLFEPGLLDDHVLYRRTEALPLLVALMCRNRTPRPIGRVELFDAKFDVEVFSDDAERPGGDRGSEDTPARRHGVHDPIGFGCVHYDIRCLAHRAMCR